MAHAPLPPRDDRDARTGAARDDLDRDGVRTGDRDRKDRLDRDDLRDAPAAKTSAAATFALVFGLSALLSFLTLILAPLALVLSIIGIVLGVVGLKMAKRRGVTGKGLAIAGLVMSGLVLLLSILGIIGVSTFLNNDQAVERLQTQVQELADRLPQQVEQELPTGS